jgi:creatinine amidohydrolase
MQPRTGNGADTGVNKDSHLIERLTWEELDSAVKDGVDAVLIPVGSTEQHGPHMPLDTDSFIAAGLCTRVADLAADLGSRFLIAPTLSISLSWYHMQFPGSIRLRTDTFLRVFDDVCDSLAQHGLGRVIAVNGHGGNAAALTVAVNSYRERTGRHVIVAQWWELAGDVVADVGGPMIHAEEAETSVAIALGQRVLLERATRDAYDRGESVKNAGLPWTSLGKYGLTHKGPGVTVSMDMLRDISQSGVVGDATRATKDLGDRIVAAVTPRIVQVGLELAGKSTTALVGRR